MKKCPQCGREYDTSMSFCLDDGAELLYGPASVEEPATAILTTDAATISLAQTAGHVDSTDERRAPFRSKLLLGTLGAVLLLIALFGSYRYFSSTGAARQIDSVAVLPFVNRGGDADTDYLSDGLAESLIYRLSKLPNLKVSPVSSVMRYRGSEKAAAQIATELGVNALMSGRLTKRGENLSIGVELIDTRTGSVLWGEQYERKISDLLATQREIAGEVVNNLRLKLSGESAGTFAKRYTDNNDAYQLYLRGRFHFAKRNQSDLEHGVEYFKQAIELDPSFALAYAALADSYNAMTAYPYMAPKQAAPLAKAAANRAIEIDPSLAEAHTALANSLAGFDWNWKDAEREFKQALDLNPNDAGTHWRYGMFYLMPLGRLDEAIAEGKRSLELEPLDLNHGANLSGIYFYARRYDEALTQARQVTSLDSNFIVGRWALSQACIQKGLYDEAIGLNERALETDPKNPVYLRFAGIAYAKAGRRQDAERIIERFREIGKTEYVMSYHVALIYSALGDTDKAIAALKTSVSEHDYLLPRIRVEPFLDPLRGEPQFDWIVNQLNFPDQGK